MKSNILLLLLILFSMISTINAEVGIGVKGGLNLTKVRLDKDWRYDEDEIKFKSGYIVGMPFQFKVADFFSIQPEILMTLKGIKQVEEGSYDGEEWKEEYVVTLTYFDIPVLLKFSYPGEKLMPNLYIGPQISFKIFAGGYELEEYGDESDKYKFKADDKADIMEDTKPVDFSIVFGGGLSIAAGPGSVDFDFRYSLGLVNIISKDILKYYSDSNKPSVKYGALSFLIGYTFNIGK